MQKKKKSKKIRKNNKFTLENIIDVEIKKNSIRKTFTKEQIDYSNIIAKKKFFEHEDLTHIPFVTIDGKNARDFDDAVWASNEKKNLEFKVAIADVSFFIKKNDPLDKEAKKRGNSFYFPNKVIPMIPKVLSDNICSLVPNERRACIVIHFKVDHSGKLMFSNIQRAVIKTIARLNYEEVDEYLINKKKKYIYTKVIDNLFFVYSALNKISNHRGKINILRSEFVLVQKKNQKQFSIKEKKKMLSEKIIEELMIYTNATIAELLKKKKKLNPYRNHEKPNKEKLEKLKIILKQNNINLSLENVEANEFRTILENNNSKVINELILKSQSKANYQIKSIGHFGLALENYTHFTSPIRRYADILVHRALLDDSFNEERIENLLIYLTDQEKKSENIERNILAKACCLFINKNKIKKLTGHIDGFIESGIFVIADTLPLSCFIKFSSIGNDFYTFDHNEYVVSGQKTGIIFKVGDRVSFKIKSSNSKTGKILGNSLKKLE